MAIQWPLVIFSLLAGAGGALLAFVGLSEVLGLAKKARVPAAVGALVLLVVGGCASVAHLAQPANIMAAAANVFSFSGISVELIMLGVNAIVAVAYVLTARGESANATKIVGIVGIVTGVAMTFVVGNGYVMEAQPNWNTPALPFAYLGSLPRSWPRSKRMKPISGASCHGCWARPSSNWLRFWRTGSRSGSPLTCCCTGAVR